ncbi:MAG: HDOD domain-containing protein [Planctomycetota bacterium]|nr:MAG: HDOD domain-containing protein [Planctomycetota bacterium]
MGNEIDDAKLKRIVEKIRGLPTLPKILDKMNKIAGDPNASADQLGAIITDDPASTSRILRIVNSSFYGLSSRISVVSHAIVILGFNAVKSIVLSSTIFDMFAKAGKQAEFDREEFWKHSIGAGAASRALARRMGVKETEEFFVAGLLHDIGKVILDQHLNAVFLKILQTVKARNILFLDAEMALLGLNHARIGGWLFKRWDLAPHIVAAVQYHHDPKRAGDNTRFAAVIHFADILARAIRLGTGGDNKIPLADRDAWRALNIPHTELGGLFQEIGDEFDRAMIFLDFLT